MFGKKFYTVIVVPHAKARFRKLRIPYSLTVLAALLVIGVMVGIAGLSYRFANTQVKSEELAKLRQENFELRRENGKTREVTDDLRTRLDGFNETVSRFKVMFGVGGEAATGTGEMSVSEDPPPPNPNERYNAFAYLSRLKADSESLEEELQILSEELEERAVVLNSTPSIRPVRGGFVSSRFGSRTDPFTGKRVFHPALDISTWYW